MCLIVYVSRASTKRLLPVVLIRSSLRQNYQLSMSLELALFLQVKPYLLTPLTLCMCMYVSSSYTTNTNYVHTYTYVLIESSILVVEISCRGIYIAHANYIKTTSICYIATNITILTLFVASRLAPALINS